MDSRELLSTVAEELRKSENIVDPKLEARWILERAIGEEESGPYKKAVGSVIYPVIK